MTQTRRDHLRMMAAAAGAAAVPGAAFAQEGTVHEVQMLNADPENKRERQVFSPPVLKVAVGDTVKFIPTDRGHNSQTDEDMMPEGGDMWEGDVNSEVEVTFTTDGTYGFYCRPHRTAGMVGLILVGDASVNFEEAKSGRFRGKAADRYEEYFAMAEEMMAESS